MLEYNSSQSILEKYKDRYSDILKILSADTFVVWLLDVASRRLYYSSAYITSFNGDLPLPSTLDDWLKRIHSEDLARIREGWLNVINGTDYGDSTENFYRLHCAKDSYIWFLYKGTVVARNAQGEALYVVGVLTAVDTLAEKFEETITWQERAGFALEAARDGVWDWNTKTNDVYYSPRFISMLGYTPEEFPPTLDAWLVRIHKEDLEKTRLQQLTYINSPERGDLFESLYRFLAADGSYRWFLSRGKIVERDENGRARRIVGLHTDVTDLRAAQDNLTVLLNHDSLTNLHSRLYFDQAFKNLSRDDDPIAVIYVDVDTLKVVNDSLGHDAGDRLLVIAADLLRSVVRTTDIIARIGGDEFAVLMPRCSSRTAESVIRKLEDQQSLRNNNPETMPVFLSLGAAGTDQGVSVDMLLHEADQAMLRRKALSREHSRARMLEWIERRKTRSLRKTAGQSI